MTSPRFSRLAPAARVYVSGVVMAGVVAVLWSTWDLATAHTASGWLVLAALTLLSGSATIKLPSLPATITVSETFVFTSVLLFGSSAGTLTVALDALVISFWSYRKGHPLYKIIFNLFALPLTIWIASSLFFLHSGIQPLFDPAGNGNTFAVRPILFPLFLLAITYFILNSFIIAIAISLETRRSAYRLWRDNFAWLSLNYFGGASISILLVTYARNLDYGYLVLILPLILVLYLTFSSSMGRVADANSHIAQLNKLYMSTIETLAMAIDAKDQVTHGHIRRVQVYAVELAKHLGVNEPTLLQAVEAAALLHDMGKLAVPEYILNKPGPLTPAEFEKMKLHASVGAEILGAIDFPYPVVPIVRHHHENWDGTGYPDRLAGADIPMGARILSVVDCFDALTSDRPYRPKLSDAEALAILTERRGSMYDPLVVDTFLRVNSEIAMAAKASAGEEVKFDVRSAALPPGRRDSGGSHVDTSSDARITEALLALIELANAPASRSAIADLANVLFGYIRSIVPASLCTFYVFEAETDTLRILHASGDITGSLSGLRIGIGQRLSGWVAAHRTTVRNSNPALDLGDTADLISPGLLSMMSTPMMLEGKLFGVLAVHTTKSHAYTDESQRLLEVMSGTVASILRSALVGAAERASVGIDGPTGLPNAQRLRALLDAEGGTPRLPYPLAALTIRIEGAIRGNVMAIDQLLSCVRESVPVGSLLFRISEKELVVVILDSDAHSAASAASGISALADQLTQTGTRVEVLPSNLLLDGKSLTGFLLSSSSFSGLLTPHSTSLPNAQSDSVH